MVLRYREIFHSPGKFVAWCEGKRGASWAGAPGEQVSVVLPELPIFPLLPPRFVPASCASTALVELSSDWSGNWSRLKITFWGWWEGPKHNCRVQQGAQKGAEKLRVAAAALAINHHQRKYRKLSLCSCGLLLPAVLQTQPSAQCCLFLLLLSPRSYCPSWAAAGVNPSSLGSKWAELTSIAKS